MPVTKKCKECGKIYYVSPYKENSSLFCSKECQYKNMTGIKKSEWITKICPSCGKSFEVLKSKDKKYCSEICLHERNENYMMYNCDCCGKEIRIKKTLYNELLEHKRGRKTILCSRECTNKIKNNGHNIVCLNCGKVFYRTEFNINRHDNNYCCQKCQFEYQHKQKFEIRNCEVCRNKFECSKTSTQRFCSSKCNSLWQKTIIGEDNPRYRRINLKCDYCNKDIFITENSKNTYEHHFCSVDCKIKWFGEVWSQDEVNKEKARERMIDILTSGAISTTNSKPQQILDNLLHNIHIEFEREKSVKYYCVDNYLIKSNLMIEVQGDYWHANPIKFNTFLTEQQINRISRDKAKHTYIKNNYDIEILYIWENDLYNNINLCEKIILKYINNNGILSDYNSFNYNIDNDELILNQQLIIPYQKRNIKEYKKLLKVS